MRLHLPTSNHEPITRRKSSSPPVSWKMAVPSTVGYSRTLQCVILRSQLSRPLSRNSIRIPTCPRYVFLKNVLYPDGDFWYECMGLVINIPCTRFPLHRTCR